MLLIGVQGKIHLSTNYKPVLGDYPPPPHKNSTKHYFVVKVLKVVLRFMTMILERIKEQVQEHIPMVIKRFEEV